MKTVWYKFLLKESKESTNQGLKNGGSFLPWWMHVIWFSLAQVTPCQSNSKLLRFVTFYSLLSFLTSTSVTSYCKCLHIYFLLSQFIFENTLEWKWERTRFLPWTYIILWEASHERDDAWVVNWWCGRCMVGIGRGFSWWIAKTKNSSSFLCLLSRR